MRAECKCPRLHRPGIYIVCMPRVVWGSRPHTARATPRGDATPINICFWPCRPWIHWSRPSARRACSAHVARLPHTPTPSAPHWAPPSARTRGGCAKCSCTHRGFARLHLHHPGRWLRTAPQIALSGPRHRGPATAHIPLRAHAKSVFPQKSTSPAILSSCSAGRFLSEGGVQQIFKAKLDFADQLAMF